MRKLLLASITMVSAMSVNAEQTFTHMEIAKGFTQDVICENVSNIETNVTHSDVDGWEGLDGCCFVFYTKAVQEQGALCGDDGMFTSSRTGATFKVNPAGDNALVLKSTTSNGLPIEGTATEGTLEFKTPIAAKSIYVVGTSAEGDSNLDITINYEDGTNAKDNITMYNWDSTTAAATSAAVVSGLGRMAGKKNWEGAVGHISSSYNFNLFESAVNTDNTKKIKSVTIQLLTSGRCASIFAVSTSDEVVAGIDGIAADTVMPVSYYTITGRKLQAPVKGVNIVKYSNGKAAKVVY